MRMFILCKVLFKRQLLELQRYAFNTFFSLVSAYMIFFLIFLGARSFIGSTTIFGETLSVIVVGFMLWFFAVLAYSGVTSFLVQEAYQGTLEQLAMSPFGLDRVLLLRTCISLLFNLGISLILLFVMMVSTGKWLYLDFPSILPLLLLTASGVLGIGFIMGGLALIFKQVQASFQLLQFFFAALIMTPLDKYPFVKYLPFSWGMHLTARVMIEEHSILEVPWSDLLFLLVNSAFYFGLGFLVFKICERIARDQGLLY
jgi:ABC-2 type transport system permease protein